MLHADSPIPRRRAIAGAVLAALSLASRAGAGQPPLITPVGRASRRPQFRGVDLSFLPQLDDLGVTFFDGAIPRDPLLILRDRGINTVRLRVWNNPPGGYCSTARTLAMAQRARSAGLKLLIDFHYSDTWADPGQQTPPAAWAGLSTSQLESAVASFTGGFLSALNAQNTPPDLVQIGNEVTDGMLWPKGRISANGWSAFARLFNAGADAVHHAAPGTPVLLHTDRGGDNPACRWFYGSAIAAGLRFDHIALSYYPWWHGTLAAVAANLTDLATRFARPLHIVETSYPWTLAWNDNTGNLVGLPSQCLAAFPPTPDGQARYTAALSDVLASLPDGLGRGLCWWAPEAVAAPGFGSPVENLTLFDFSNRVLPAAAALGGAHPPVPSAP